MLAVPLLVALVAAYLVAAPVGGTVSALRAEPEPTAEFRRALQDEYLSLAAREARSMSDWADSQYFTLKAMQAGRGSTPAPERLKDWWLPESARPDLAAARDRLMAMLGQGGAAVAPSQAARAQAAFDCWVERQEENWDTEGITLCRDRFEQAVGAARAGARPGTPPQISLNDFDLQR